METKHEIVSINEKASLHFVFIPEGYEFKNATLEGHKIKRLGKFKSLNKIKMLKQWQDDNGCLVKAFTKILESRGWDFNKFPNPDVFATVML